MQLVSGSKFETMHSRGHELSSRHKAVPTWAKLVRTLAVEFGQDGAFVVG
jgi:hypothetical protein